MQPLMQTQSASPAPEVTPKAKATGDDRDGQKDPFESLLEGDDTSDENDVALVPQKGILRSSEGIAEDRSVPEEAVTPERLLAEDTGSPLTDRSSGEGVVFRGEASPADGPDAELSASVQTDQPLTAIDAAGIEPPEVGLVGAVATDASPQKGEPAAPLPTERSAPPLRTEPVVLQAAAPALQNADLTRAAALVPGTSGDQPERPAVEVQVQRVPPAASTTAPFVMPAQAQTQVFTAVINTGRMDEIAGLSSPSLARADALMTLASGVDAPRFAALGTAPVLPQPNVVLQQIATILPGRADGQVELRLDPPELGNVRLQFSQSDGSLLTLVSAERPEIDAMLRRHADGLLAMLKEAGFDDVSLQFGDHAQQGMDQQAEHAQSGEGGRSSMAETVVLSVPVISDRLDLRM